MRAPSRALDSKLGTMKTAFPSIRRDILRLTVRLERPNSPATSEYGFLGSLEIAEIISISVEDGFSSHCGNQISKTANDFAPTKPSIVLTSRERAREFSQAQRTHADPLKCSISAVTFSDTGEHCISFTLESSCKPTR